MSMPIPQHISTQRTYEGRITAVHRRTTPTSDPTTPSEGEQGDDISFTYDAIGVDTPDFVPVLDATPFRRIIKSDLSDRPQIVPATIGSPCRIDLSTGTPRLIDVLEQYIVDDCPPPDPTPDPIPAIPPGPIAVDPVPPIPV